MPRRDRSDQNPDGIAGIASASCCSSEFTAISIEIGVYSSRGGFCLIHASTFERNSFARSNNSIASASDVSPA
jgi:hypothetical protein